MTPVTKMSFFSSDTGIIIDCKCAAYQQAQQMPKTKDKMKYVLLNRHKLAQASMAIAKIHFGSGRLDKNRIEITPNKPDAELASAAAKTEMKYFIKSSSLRITELRCGKVSKYVDQTTLHNPAENKYRTTHDYLLRYVTHI